MPGFHKSECPTDTNISTDKKSPTTRIYLQVPGLPCTAGGSNPGHPDEEISVLSVLLVYFMICFDKF